MRGGPQSLASGGSDNTPPGSPGEAERPRGGALPFLRPYPALELPLEPQKSEGRAGLRQVPLLTLLTTRCPQKADPDPERGWHFLEPLPLGSRPGSFSGPGLWAGVDEGGRRCWAPPGPHSAHLGSHPREPRL